MINHRSCRPREALSGARIDRRAESTPSGSASLRSDVIRAVLYVPRRQAKRLLISVTRNKTVPILQVTAAVVTFILDTHLGNLLGCCFVRIRRDLTVDEV